MTDQPPYTLPAQFTFGSGDDQVTAAVSIPFVHRNLTQLLPILYSLSDSVSESVASKLSQTGQPISCKAGCGACCRLMVPLNLFEAEALAGWIRSQPEAKQQELAQRFETALAKLAAAGLVDRMVSEDWRVQSDSALKVVNDYFSAQVPCPFLEDESCSIYPIRPLICREYLVTSPPEQCSDLAKPVTRVNLPLVLTRVLDSIGAELDPNRPGWIPLVFLFDWMKTNVHPGNGVAGLAPMLIAEIINKVDQTKPAAPESLSPSVP
jgi:Fe-S-cluster containining protein